MGMKILRKIMGKRVKYRYFEASFTVEASWVMVICLGIVMGVILLGYELFYDTMESVAGDGMDIQAVSWFRMCSAGKELLQ